METDSVSLRELKCELNVLSRSDGSVIFSQGNTVVIVSVHGPVECKMVNSDKYKASLEVCFAIKSGQTAVRERQRETIIKQTCETALFTNLHPRDAVSINIQEMEDTGGLIATSLNACCLALMHSGLAMKFLFAAVQCGVKETGEVVMDPTTQESSECVAHMTFVFDGADKNLITSLTEGSFSTDKYLECMTQCRRASENIFLYYRDVVKKYMKVS